MKLKKKTLQQRLQQYHSSARPLPGSQIALPSAKSTLMVLAPFAAGALLLPTNLNAQCGQGTATFDPSGGSYSDGAIDVDGDGNVDFQFDIAGSLFITPVGTMSVGLATASYAQYLSTGEVISNTSPPSGFASTGYFVLSNSAYFTNGTAFSYHVPIRDAAGHLGFIRIEKDGAGNFTVGTAATGVAQFMGNVNAGDCSSLLPVEWLAFTAEATKEKTIGLHWSTATESNNRGFEVQRSTDGVNFFKIGWVNGEGNSDREVQYQFHDQNVLTNTVYYFRLRQLDYDGAESFSQVQTAQLKQAGLGLDIFPNPVEADQKLTVNVAVERASSSGVLSIFNMNGQLVQQEQMSFAAGLNTLDLPVENLTAGTYVLKLTDGADTRYEKFTVQ